MNKTPKRRLFAAGVIKPTAKPIVAPVKAIAAIVNGAAFTITHYPRVAA